MVVDEEGVARRFAAITSFLDERQRRLWLGVEAREAGYGGVSAVARATGMSRPTVAKAVRELDEPAVAVGRVRRPGGGRKPAVEVDPGLIAALQALVDPATRGDPESPLLWSSKSTRELADALAVDDHHASHTLVGRLLKQLGYSLQAMAKTTEGNQHPDRDAQFRYLASQVNTHRDSGQPVVSVDTKESTWSGRPRGSDEMLVGPAGRGRRFLIGAS